jgi:hypothetical protein
MTFIGFFERNTHFVNEIRLAFGVFGLSHQRTDGRPAAQYLPRHNVFFFLARLRFANFTTRSAKVKDLSRMGFALILNCPLFILNSTRRYLPR